MAESEVTYLVLLPKWNFSLRSIHGPVLDSARQGILLLVLASPVEGFEHLAGEVVQAYIFEDHSAGGELGQVASHLLSIPSLDVELHVITKLNVTVILLSAFDNLVQVEDDLLDHVCSLNEPISLFHAVDNPLVLDRCGWILQSDSLGSKVSWSLDCRHLEADLLTSGKGHVALHVDDVEREEETLAPVLIADPALHLRAVRWHLHLGGDCSDHPLLAHHHLGGDLAHPRGDRLACASVIGHLELHGIADLEVLYVAVKLREVEEEPGLSITALYKAVAVEQLLNDPSLPDAHSRLNWTIVTLSTRAPSHPSTVAVAKASAPWIVHVEGANLKVGDCRKASSASSSSTCSSVIRAPALVPGSDLEASIST